jgi:hypothetical protein
MEALRKLALRFETPTPEPAVKSPGPNTECEQPRKPPAEEEAIPWNQDAWEELQPLPRRLLQHMLGRVSDTIANVAEKVWGTDSTSEGAIAVAINRANQFLQKQGDARVISKLRGEGVICWK